MNPRAAAEQRLYALNGVDVPGHPYFEQRALDEAHAQAEEAFDAAAAAGWRFLRLDDDGKIIEEWTPPA